MITQLGLDFLFLPNVLFDGEEICEQVDGLVCEAAMDAG